jgi:hypothetical protein
LLCTVFDRFGISVRAVDYIPSRLMSLPALPELQQFAGARSRMRWYDGVALIASPLDRFSGDNFSLPRGPVGLIFSRDIQSQT